MQIRLTPAVKALMIACFATFLVQQTVDQFFNGNLLGWFALIPSGVVIGHRFWQLFTYAFLHADVLHLFFNLMMLAFIGGEIEAAWGRARFLRYYFFCSVSAGFLYLLLQVLIQGEGIHVPMVGASAAIYGLLIAYGLTFGERQMLFMMIFPMKAKHFVLVLAGIEFMTSVFSGRGGLASVAHLGGMAAGFAYLWVRATWVVAQRRRREAQGGRPAVKAKKKRSSQHLKLVVNKAGGERDSESEEGEDPKTWH